MLYDSHIHFIPQELSTHTIFYKGVWADKENLYEFLEVNNIEKAFLVYPSTDAHIKLGNHDKVCDLYNDALERILGENSKIIAAGIVNVNNVSNIASGVKSLKVRGFKAISLASSYNGKFIVNELYPLFEAAQNYNLPIFIHPQTINPIGFERVKDPLLMPVLEYSFDISTFLGLLMMEGVLEKFEVKFIFSSLAGVMPFLKERFDRVYTMLRKRELVKDLGKPPTEILKKVYVDTSGASLKDIGLALDLFGEDKILWGSDYPVNVNIKENLMMLDGLGKEMKERITFQNFLQLGLL
ncbi:MAG: amidohydrolase [Candidatus Omnitrophica bacterium]|nr:amidohydrolase [Candidatus Omnitrophota bacterium]MBU0878017.1 amidohydrolase [Candidatus Omnitrophota bacterium]MBU0896508.1 amidohydrolase [Candidatus Omnitrophota bacterium]MBU1133738.1 amidohydrolase [Candidatus Omnitrophota bacterium]MBU1367407.1 amidohydrolase [Candidatus Omnitrophota bacterium]